MLPRYPLLRETPLADPAQRTEWNVRLSDAVLILLDEQGPSASKGTALAQDVAQRYGKPALAVTLGRPDAAIVIGRWLNELPEILISDPPWRIGIGGPRESEAPGIYAKARDVLRAVFKNL